MINSSTWAEINLQNIKYNVNSVKKALNKGTNLCCVVKANAYGHGAVEVSKFLEKENVVIKKISYEEAKLEDVFLTLTGKNLRD